VVGLNLVAGLVVGGKVGTLSSGLKASRSGWKEQQQEVAVAWFELERWVTLAKSGIIGSTGGKPKGQGVRLTSRMQPNCSPAVY